MNTQESKPSLNTVNAIRQKNCVLRHNETGEYLNGVLSMIAKEPKYSFGVNAVLNPTVTMEDMFYNYKDDPIMLEEVKHCSLVDIEILILGEPIA